MAVFRIIDPVEARRAKYSLYKGAGPAELQLNGEKHFAQVLSVSIIPDESPDAWLVSINSIERRDPAQRPRLKIRSA